MSVKKARLKREMLTIPTYEPGKPNELPFFLENKPYQGATGRLYPLPYTDRLSNTPVPKEYDAVTLENDYIRTVLLPELGGKIHGAVDLTTGYEFIYQNTVIKPALVGLAGPWVSGGVEFNWPQHHRPTTFMPLEAVTRENPDGSVTCYMGEAEPFNRMRGTAAVTVYPDKSYVEAKAVVCNRTDRPLPFMWWNNLAVRVHPHYKATFPPDAEWGNDHDRRAVISFPVMKGVYKTARPFDYGDGTDVTWYSAVKLPTSVMVSKGQSDMDFLAGWDFDADEGTVTVSDHRYSTGKKMWTWGDGDFGHAWCANLTDNGDRYIELMTGVYTDNQPDFSYIQPGETKCFSQIWYPVRGIGEVKNASRAGAVSMEVRENAVSFGGVVTEAHEAMTLRLTYKGNVVKELTRPLDPKDYILLCAELDGIPAETDLCVTLSDGDHVLVSYQPKPRGKKKPPEARPIPPRPADVPTVEECYLHGAHLLQYKHHTYKPEDYFTEALRRDPGDLRSNHAMGNLYTERGDYTAAAAYYETAYARLTMRNANPADTQLLCDYARMLLLTGDGKRAYDLYADASWQYGQHSAACYALAQLDCIAGNYDAAEEHLIACLETNAKHLGALTLLGWLKKDASMIEEVLKISPLDTFARYALYLMGKGEIGGYVKNRPEDVLDAAMDFLSAGFREEAVTVLRTCEAPSQLIYYHIAYLTGEKPLHTDLPFCHPNRLTDIPVLAAYADEWQAQYLLGCLYYDRMNYRAAEAAWEASMALNPAYAPTKRNLAQAYFDHENRPKEARSLLEDALALDNSARILYELLQLYKNTGVSPKERIAMLEAHPDLLMQRDDCYLDYIILLTQENELERAKELLTKKRFNIYEGGEGKLTRHHGWLYTLLGRRAEAAGNTDAALAFYRNALIYPANYGEGRHYSAQEANIYYYTGCLLASMGDREGAEAAFRRGAGQPPQRSEMTYFAGLCEEALGNRAAAEAVFRGMCESGQALLADADLPGYFGVGMPSPAPYEQDHTRLHTLDAYLLTALGRKGLGDETGAEEAAARLAAEDPYNMKLTFFRMLGILNA